MYIGTFEQNGKFGFKDKWNIVLPAIYEAAQSFKDGFAVVVLDGKFGIINTSGEFVVENKYDDIHHLFGNFFRARINSDNDWNCGVIDTDGNIVVDFSFKSIYYIDDKYFKCFKTAQSKEEGLKYLNLYGRYRYSNEDVCEWFSTDGKLITSYDVTDVCENYLIIKNEADKFGLVRDDGSIILTCKYDTLQYGVDGIVVASLHEENETIYCILNSDDNILVSSNKEISFECGFFYIESESDKQWYSFEGNLVYTGKATPLSKSFLEIYKNGKCGVLDFNGSRIINFIYDEIKFDNTHFIVRRDSKIGLLGLKGEVIIDVIYDKIESVIIENNPISLGVEEIPQEVWGSFHYSGYCKEYGFDTLGHQNSEGKKFERLKRQFIKVNGPERFHPGHTISDSSIDLTKPLILTSNGKQELFKVSEGIIANSLFDSVEQITPLCYVVKSNDKYGVFRIDTQSLIIEAIYDRVQFYGGHTVLISKEGKWGAKTLILESNFFHLLFDVNIPVENTEIKILDDLQTLFGAKRVHTNYSNEEIEYYTLLDQSGKEVEGLQDLFEDMFSYYDYHHIMTKQNGKYGFISKFGYITLPFIYDEIIIRKTGGYNVRIGDAWGVIDINCHELVRVKYSRQIPINIAAPKNSYFDYDDIKDDVAKVTKHYKDLFIVNDAISGRFGCLNRKGEEVIPTIFEHLMFNTPDEYDKLTSYEDDVLFFGYGGYESDSDFGRDFFSDIDGAKWGCIDNNGIIIIEPKYDCFKTVGQFLLGGRDGSFLGEEGNDSYYCDNYSGVYDLYSRDGELIIGGFRELYLDEETGVFAIFFGGKWERYCSYEDDWNSIYCYNYQFKYLNDLWLIIDRDLNTVVRKDDGRQHQFSKGFIGKIEIKEEDNKSTHVYNMPIKLMVKGFSHFGTNCAFIKDSNHENAKVAALDFATGNQTDFYEAIDQISDNRFFASDDNHKIAVISFNEIILPFGFSLVTNPEGGYFFAVKQIDEKNSTVQLFNLKNLHSPICTAIKTMNTAELFDEIGFGRLKLSLTGGDSISDIQVPLRKLFDDEFISLIHPEENGFFCSKWKSHYYFSYDYLIGSDFHDDSDYGDDDHDYMRDSWDAMTDGMYGDMPDGFDGDFSFLGR